MLHYKGGAWIPGVPARDLTDDEVEQFGLAMLLASGLYEIVNPPEAEEVKEHGNRHQEAKKNPVRS